MKTVNPGARDGTRIGIVGGGVLALTLAMRLRERGHYVTVFERSPAVGGLASATEIGEYSCDRFPHVIRPTDVHLRALLEDVNLGPRLKWGVARSAFHIAGKPYPLSSLRDFLRFPALGFIDKARLALTILRAGHARNEPSLEEQAAADWLRRWSGQRAYERIWLPLLRSRLGENHGRANAAFAAAAAARTYLARRIHQDREVLGYVDGGYAVILESLARHLANSGVQLESGVPVVRVIDGSESATIMLKDGRSAAFDHVLVTTPPPIAARLCPQLTDGERVRLERVSYEGVVCVAALLRRPLGDAYITHIATPGMPFSSVIEATSLISPARFGGHTLVYLPRYVSKDDSYWSLSDRAIRNRFLSALGALNRRLAAGDVVACAVSRARHALPIPTRNYSRDALPPMETSRPRLSLVNAAQVAQGPFGIDALVALAEEQAARLDARLAPRDVRVHTPWTAYAATNADGGS